MVETYHYNGVMYDFVDYFPVLTRFLIMSNFKKQLIIHKAYFNGGDGPDLSMLKLLVSFPENLKGWAKGKPAGFGNVLWVPTWDSYFDIDYNSKSKPLTIEYYFVGGPIISKEFDIRNNNTVLIGYWAPDYV